jgi:hypothetical protein
MLRRYWFRFDPKGVGEFPPGVAMGCGVSAYNYDDALRILRKKVFHCDLLPPILRCIQDVDISKLDEGHVRPNMGVVTERGVWFPLGYR